MVSRLESLDEIQSQVRAQEIFQRQLEARIKRTEDTLLHQRSSLAASVGIVAALREKAAKIQPALGLKA